MVFITRTTRRKAGHIFRSMHSAKVVGIACRELKAYVLPTPCRVTRLLTYIWHAYKQVSKLHVIHILSTHTHTHKKKKESQSVHLSNNMYFFLTLNCPTLLTLWCHLNHRLIHKQPNLSSCFFFGLNFLVCSGLGTRFGLTLTPGSLFLKRKKIVNVTRVTLLS